MKLNTVIHIGFPKTGTTTHQNHLFKNHSQILYPGKPYQSESFKTGMHNLIKQESTIYQPASLKEYLAKDLLGDNERLKGKKALVVSDEIMVSVSKVRDKGVVAQRIKEVFSPCKILITLRSQLEILKSSYIGGSRLLTNVPGKYHGRFVGFEDWLEFSYKNLYRSHIGNFIYANTVDYYVRLFGKSNVLVLLFEEFIHNKEEYINKLADFLDIGRQESLELIETAHDNERIDQSTMDFEHLVASHFPIGKGALISAAVKLHRLFHKIPGKEKNKKAKVGIPGHWIERLKEVYIEGNRKLAANFDLPLKEYGYPL